MAPLFWLPRALGGLRVGSGHPALRCPLLGISAQGPACSETPRPQEGRAHGQPQPSSRARRVLRLRRAGGLLVPCPLTRGPALPPLCFPPSLPHPGDPEPCPAHHPGWVPARVPASVPFLGSRLLQPFDTPSRMRARGSCLKPTSAPAASCSRLFRDSLGPQGPSHPASFCGPDGKACGFSRAPSHWPVSMFFLGPRLG